MCTTPPHVPHKNPDNVQGRGSKPTNLVVSWNPMPEIEHNGPGFYYQVYWKRDIIGDNWNSAKISNWRQSSFLITHQPTFKRYLIKGTLAIIIIIIIIILFYLLLFIIIYYYLLIFIINFIITRLLFIIIYYSFKFIIIIYYYSLFFYSF